jgi:hypothetical protein
MAPLLRPSNLDFRHGHFSSKLRVAYHAQLEKVAQHSASPRAACQPAGLSLDVVGNY